MAKDERMVEEMIPALLSSLNCRTELITPKQFDISLQARKEIEAGLTIQIDMLAELKGDTASRATWYRTLREISVLSPNDIREIEEWPDIDGGDEYEASLNYVPLSDWKELSRLRAEGRGGIAQ